MKYLDLLKDVISEKQAPKELQKVQKDPSYSFCSIQGRHISEIKGGEGQPDPEIVEAARSLGVDVTDENIRALKTFLVTQKALAEGLVPDGWTGKAYCHGCREAVPVWPECPPEVMGCPWCHKRWQGKGGNVS